MNSGSVCLWPAVSDFRKSGMKAVSGISTTSLTSVSVVFPSRDGQITAILDQKNYVEELNRHLK